MKTKTLLANALSPTDIHQYRPLFETNLFLPEKHHRPVIRAKITRNTMSKSMSTANTIPIIDNTPISKSKKKGASLFSKNDENLKKAK